MGKIKIVICDDHPAVRFGLRSILQLDDRLEVVNEFEMANDAINYILANPVDLLILDINMPEKDGIHTIMELRLQNSPIKILAFSMYDDQNMVLSALKSGADGFLLKSADQNEIVDAIITLMNNEKYISKEMADKVIFDVIATGKTEEVLSDREKEILKLLAHDYSYEEIAKELHISRRTAETHRYNIAKKLGVRTIAGLIRYAFNSGIA